MSRAFIQLSSHLYRLCGHERRLLLHDGSGRALLDGGIAAVLDHLAEIGVEHEWVLHLHPGSATGVDDQ